MLVVAGSMRRNTLAVVASHMLDPGTVQFGAQ